MLCNKHHGIEQDQVHPIHQKYRELHHAGYTAARDPFFLISIKSPFSTDFFSLNKKKIQ